MPYSRPVLDLIRARTSWRSYASSSIEPEVKKRLLSTIEGTLTSPFGGSCRIVWLTLQDVDPNEKKQLGTYGVISGAKDFIVGITSEGDLNAVQHLGYVLEKLVLLATDLGVATCWLGGTFNRVGAAHLVGAQAGDSIPAMVALGVPTRHRHVVDVVVRLAVRAKARQPFERLFFQDTFGSPLARDKAGVLELALEAVRLAPSSKNGQPWRVIVAGGGSRVHFYNVGGWHLDRGIAVCHFDLLVKEQGLKGAWKVDDPAIEAPDGVQYVVSWAKS